MLIDIVENFNHVPVEINRVSGAHLLWRNKLNAHNGKLADEEFTDRHSWVLKDNFLSDSTRMHAGDSETAFAERYGGTGIGCNGGGARVANFNDVQLKGVGANPLAGKGAPRSHSYGGLDIQGAVKEIIYSRLLNAIAPVGAQNIYGLILLDKSSAFHNATAAPSVIMVREKVLRPAHFLPCVNFRVKPEHQVNLKSDYSRVLGIYKSIYKESLLSDFYVVLQEFLDKCADQMSFFRMARFSHNALIPSNLSIDGRVLDTGLCSFVASGTNYGQVTSYLEEAAVPALIVKELFHLINKFTYDEVVEDHFLKLYEEKFHQYVIINLGCIFGIDREMSTKLSSRPEWRMVSSRFLSLLSMIPVEKTNELPTVDTPDVTNDVMAASLFYILHGKNPAKKNQYLTKFSEDLLSLINVFAESFGDPSTSFSGFEFRVSIQVLKRMFLRSYFFITYIGFNVDEACSSGGAQTAVDLIDENDHVIGWIYEDLAAQKCTLFSCERIAIELDPINNKFIVSQYNEPKMSLENPEELRNFVKNGSQSYIIQNYDFRPFLLKLCSLLSGNAYLSFNGVKNVFS